MEMSPDGNGFVKYRSKGYWSALNLKTGKETKQPESVDMHTMKKFVLLEKTRQDCSNGKSCHDKKF